MGKSTGFMEYERKNATAVEPLERIKHFNEFHTPLPEEEQKRQGARCMDCGVPFCQSGMTIKGMTAGCPLNNLIPEWNDLVYHGNWEQAYLRLKKTSNFPEFTSRVCPALCEKACTCGLNGDAVSTRENEFAIIERAYETGLAAAKPPKVRTGKRVAVIGSGPAGLAVADQLNGRGHQVVVYEREDRVGGLLRYGIPNMKLEKRIIDRKVSVMQEEGVDFQTNIDVAKDKKQVKELLKSYDAVILACGAKNARDIAAPGRDANGIHFAVDFLTSTTKSLYRNYYETQESYRDETANHDQIGTDETSVNRLSTNEFRVDVEMKATNLQEGTYISAKGKDVIVIGGGDTGNDCVGTCIRHGCKSITQLEMMPKAPEERLESNPWPEWPLVCKTDYGQEEAIAVFGQDPRIYTTTVKEFIKDKKGNLTKVVLVSLESKVDEKTGRRMMVPVDGTEKEIPCQLALIAAGFLGAENYVTDAFGVKVTPRTNVATEEGTHRTNIAKVFTAGDMHTGQSLVVKAIREGRDCAREVDEFLMGYTNL